MHIIMIFLILHATLVYHLSSASPPFPAAFSSSIFVETVKFFAVRTIREEAKLPAKWLPSHWCKLESKPLWLSKLKTVRRSGDMILYTIYCTLLCRTAVLTDCGSKVWYSFSQLIMAALFGLYWLTLLEITISRPINQKTLQIVFIYFNINAYHVLYSMSIVQT